jgi:SAM-dependent methyltransferase
MLTPASQSLFRARQATTENWNIAEGLCGNLKQRQNYVEYLRKDEWVVFTPREIDFQRFRELAESDPYIASETDPRILAEILVRKYPELFITVDHVYSVVTDWGIRRSLKRPVRGTGADDPPQIPPHLIEAFSEEELVILAKGFFRKWVRRLNQDPEKTIVLIEKLEKTTKHQKEKQLLHHVLEIIRELCKMRFPSFNAEIVPGIPFPSMHVRLWIKQLMERVNAIIIGDVGTQKTSAAVIGLEMLRSKATVVFCRSYARETVWVNELKRYYRNAPDPFVFVGNGDTRAIEKMGPEGLRRHRFLIVGYGGIQSGNEDDECVEDGDRLVEAISACHPDSVIIDEAHAIKGCGKRASRTLRVARLKSVKHRLMLTATPYENAANEVANMATLLDPQAFPNEETFVAQCRNNPRLYFGLMSSKTLDYFAQEDVLNLPPSNYTTLDFFPTIELECPPDIAKVHRAIADDGQLEARLQVQRMTRFLTIPFVAKGWYPHAADLPCFSDPLANPKLAYLKKRTAELIRKGKVVIASGIYADGVTSQRSDFDEDPETYEIARLFESWFPGKVKRFDTVVARANGGKARQEICDAWRFDPEIKILVVSVQSAAESVNLTVQKSPNVERVSIFHICLPWKATMYCQFNGRFRRPGSEVPVDSHVLVIKNTADEALLHMNEIKWRNFLIGVHGMPLLAVEERALEKATFEKLTVSPKRWLRAAFGRMAGAGEGRIAKMLSGTLQGLPVGQTIADYYLETEDISTTGHIARYAVPVLREWRDLGLITAWENVHDAGCGTLPYERRLNEPIFGTDMNPAMIETGRAHSYHRGKNTREARLSALPKEWTGRFEVNLAALVLHLTSSAKGKDKEPERVKILRELNRTLRMKGLLWILLPKFCLEEESFKRFVIALNGFGFETVNAQTGYVEASDHREHPFAFWSIALRKTAEVPEGGLGCPLFIFEQLRSDVAVGIKRGYTPPTSGTMVTVKHERFTLTQLIAPRSVSIDPVNRGNRYKRFAEALVAKFKIRNRQIVETINQKLLSARPKKWLEFKSVWKQIGTMRRAPHIDWKHLRSFWVKTFK